eukprot:244952_1
MAKKNRILPQSKADRLALESEAPASFSLYCVTWNLAGKLPSLPDLSYLLPTWPPFDMYVISTQECGQSVSMNIVLQSLTVNKWRKLLTEYFNSTCGKHSFELVANDALLGINMIIFARKSRLSSHITNIESQTIPTGIGGVVGNKGGVAISFLYNHKYSFLFINSHFHAHQDNTIIRHRDYETINRNITIGSNSNTTNQKRVTETADFVIWSGDLNYRINGNRQIMDVLLKQKQFDILLQNDQLNIAKSYNQIFENGFIESKIVFPPTYKYDLHCDEYDTSKKARIPSWTDRILYKSNNNHSHFITNMEYDANTKLKISDHRAVFASFEINLKPEPVHSVINMDQKCNEAKVQHNTKMARVGVIKSLCRYYRLLCGPWVCWCHSWKPLKQLAHATSVHSDKKNE